MELSVVIPAFNESACIRENIIETCHILRKHGICDYEVKENCA